MGLISGFVTFIKTGNPLFFKSRCQIWSELIQTIPVRPFAHGPPLWMSRRPPLANLCSV